MPRLAFNQLPPRPDGSWYYLEGHGGDASNTAVAAARRGLAFWPRWAFNDVPAAWRWAMMDIRYHSRIVVALAIALLPQTVRAEGRFPGPAWHAVSPASSGWSMSGLAAVRETARSLNTTALMIVHRGAVVAEDGDTAKRTQLASVRKSLLSALIGIAVAEKKISLDHTLAQFRIDDSPPSLSAVEKQATVRMLLQARSGVYHSTVYETAAMEAQRPARFSHAPGTFWYYNNWDFNALGTIYERATGVSIHDAVDKFIARPIGMQDYRPSDGTYVTGPDSIHPAYPMRMSARDLARFALLYLNGGQWAGKQVIPGGWVRESTRSWSRAGSGRGYGYMWWTAEPDGGLPEGTFFAWGAGGQYAFCIPARDLVVISRVDRAQGLDGPRFAEVAAMVKAILQAGAGAF